MAKDSQYKWSEFYHHGHRAGADEDTTDLEEKKCLMLYVSFGAATPIEGIDVGGVNVVLLVDLEARVYAENIMEVRHLISIYW